MNAIEKYAEREGARVAALIDETMGFVVHPKPSWMPEWLYNMVVKECVEFVRVQK